MSPKPNKVIPKDNYKLLVEFDNGEEKTFDMQPLLKYPIYEELRDEFLFREAKVKYGTAIWNEEIDIDPDRLYLESEK